MHSNGECSSDFSYFCDVLVSRRPGRTLKLQKIPCLYHVGRGQFYLVLRGSAIFGPRGSTALGFGGHARCAFPEMAEEDIESVTLLDREQKERRKRLAADALDALKRYIKQCFDDNDEIVRRYGR